VPTVSLLPHVADLAREMPGDSTSGRIPKWAGLLVRAVVQKSYASYHLVGRKESVVTNELQIPMG